MPNFVIDSPLETLSRAAKIRIPVSAGPPGDVQEGSIWEDSSNGGALTIRITGGTDIALAAGMTTEQVQDIVGAFFGDTSAIDVTYDDGGNAISATVAAGGVTNAMLAGSIALSKLVNATATSRVIGRITAGSGAWEELTGANIRTILGTLDADTLNGQSAAALQTTITAAIVDSAPGALDTLNELAAALGDDANFATTVTTSLNARARVFEDLIGNGSDNPITVTHSLNNSYVDVSVWRVSDGVEVHVGVDVTGVNAVDVGPFASTPATDSYRVVVLAK